MTFAGHRCLFLAIYAVAVVDRAHDGGRYVKSVMRDAEVGATAACPKGLRHGFGVHALRSGVPFNLLQRWLGHADITMTAIYADVMGAEEREIAARMWQ